MSGGFLFDIRVLELADERGEYCGKLLAGAGADVIKVEPPEGSPTRRIGPFVDGVEDPEKSLHFWHYNFGKRSVALDLAAPEGRERFKSLVAEADVVLESHPPGYLASLGLGFEELSQINPRLVMASISPFGQHGPYRDWQGSDLVHLAMGGVMMCTGYDPTPEGEYDTPPIAPQMWHSSHIVGSQTADAIIAALLYREKSGRGQYVDASIHRAVSCNTGTDIPFWVFSRLPTLRQTGRYGMPVMVPETLAATKDGRHVLAFVSSEFRIGREHQKWIDMLDAHGAADDLTDEKYQDLEYVLRPEAIRHFHAVARRWVAGYKYERDVWKEAQALRLHWAPVRRPEDNLFDPHWRERATFQSVHHEELGRSIDYVSAPWLSEECPWRTGPRAPRIGEHNGELLGRAPAAPVRSAPPPAAPPRGAPPFALEGVRILDLAWVVAGAGGPRILAGLGAEVIRVEWKGRLDTLRTGGGIPVGEERERVLRGESLYPTRVGVNQGSVFAEVNPGKRSIGLNLKSARGVELLHDLVAVSDVVVENFTARLLEKFGVTYESMRAVNPSIIYMQQPGFGRRGRYADFLSSAPVGEAFSGLTEMAGMPTPYPPSGWGYLYLDWSASYYCAMALLAALYYREKTGRGQYIDGSLCEPGLLLTGTAMLDYQVNGQAWQRIGNASPYKPACPHGAYRCRGEERWIAIAVFTDEAWRALAGVLGDPAWMREERLASLASRLQHASELDALIEDETRSWEPFELMQRLQAAGVAAGVCQTAEDRVERDPQLARDSFMTPLTNSEVGSWPIRQFPVELSETPSRPGGPVDRGHPCYAEDNDYVYGSLLGLSESERRALAEQDVI
ncbi:MAG: CoA transferase [Deltaproteobacteria bacterium]|nr:CoA transferase [Deltaproteobacteria bacterium]MBW2421397.1 CoA transferase [Deltaproteobacteria bacterium]